MVLIITKAILNKFIIGAGFPYSVNTYETYNSHINNGHQYTKTHYKKVNRCTGGISVILPDGLGITRLNTPS